MNRSLYTIILRLLLGVILLVSSNQVFGEDSEQEFRASATLGYKLANQFKLKVTPELRFSGDRSLDKYLLEGKVSYKASQILALEATYRFIGNVRKEKDTEYWNRIALSSIVKKEFHRFEPSLRLRYSNYADDDRDDKTFLRYKTSMSYDVPKFKGTPSVSIEAFQQLSDYGLYKIRYGLDLSFKIVKKNSVGLSYKLDVFNDMSPDSHIFGLDYKLKF